MRFPASDGIDIVRGRPAAERTGGIDRKGVAALRRGGWLRLPAKPQIHDSKSNEICRTHWACHLFILFGAQPAEDASDAKELRASAAPRLRPAAASRKPQMKNSLRHRVRRQARSRAEGPAFERREHAALRPGRAAGCCAHTGANSELLIGAAAYGGALEADLRTRATGLCRAKAGCRCLWRRVCRKTPRQQPNGTHTKKNGCLNRQPFC